MRSATGLTPQHSIRTDLRDAYPSDAPSKHSGRCDAYPRAYRANARAHATHIPPHLANTRVRATLHPGLTQQTIRSVRRISPPRQPNARVVLRATRNHLATHRSVRRTTRTHPTNARVGATTQQRSSSRGAPPRTHPANARVGAAHYPGLTQQTFGSVLRATRTQQMLGSARRSQDPPSGAQVRAAHLRGL